MTAEKVESGTLSNVRNQYYATFAANLIMISHGLLLGWVAPALSKLTTIETPLLFGPLTNEQVSWIGSINCIGGIFGSFFFGYIIPNVGSKRAIYCLALPCVSFWVLVFFAKYYYHILIARFLSGFVGTQTPLLLYISEIAIDDMRGRLGSTTLFSRNVGILIAYILGAKLDYEYIPCISVIVPIIFVLLFVTLPNTPRFYLNKGKPARAEKALKFYKSYEEKTKEEEVALYIEFERLKSLSGDRKSEESLQASDFFNRDAMKGIAMAIALTIISQVTANFVIVSYSVLIFQKLGTSIDPYISSISLAVTLMLGSFASTYLGDKLRRKTLMIMSLIGSAIGMFAITLYQHFLNTGYDLSAFAWIPVVSLSFVIFISSAGILPISLICSVELMPAKIRTTGVSIATISLSLAAFCCVKVFPVLMETIGLDNCMALFGTLCVVGALFVIYVVKETSGQCLDDVGTEKPQNAIDSSKVQQPLIE